ncbi:MAG: 2-oxo acid dehydrogenase subunit E2 [Bdellovibrionales bacterium]|nr:2-oxo acid dehydrogenase subunit E2 [Bdellovibrionales bacterium]
MMNAETQEVRLPDIGEGVVEGELVRWLVKIGDKVLADQAVAEVMTDKATVEVPSPIAGTVKELKVKEGDTVPIETVMLLVQKELGQSTKPQSPETKSVQTKPIEPQEKKIVATAAPVASEINPPVADTKVLATPSTRRLAREMGIDINQVNGTGLVGRVTREDVLKNNLIKEVISHPKSAMESKIPPSNTTSFVYKNQNFGSSLVEEKVPLRGVRKKIAENMQNSKHTIPHFTLVEEAQVTELVKLRAQAKEQAEKRGVKITYLPFVIKALLATVREFPMFNASIDDSAAEIIYKKYYHVGFAADTPNGLMVPVIKFADQKTLLELSHEIQELAQKARAGKLALDEMRGATITVTNIGSVAGLYATPIINHPEVAILGMYKIQDRPVWKENSFVRAQVMNFSMTCDHRLIDGAVAANFMKAFVNRLENPSVLMLDMI